MTLVDPEYAGEFAVLATWLSALLPITVTTVSGTAQGSSFRILTIQWFFGRYRHLGGLDLAQSRLDRVAATVELPGYVVPELATAMWLWVGAGVVVLATLALSVAYYSRERGIEDALPVDPAVALGAGLVAGAALAGVGSVLTLGERLVVPIGVPIVAILGGAAIQAGVRRDRRDGPPADRDSTATADASSEAH